MRPEEIKNIWKLISKYEDEFWWWVIWFVIVTIVVMVVSSGDPNPHDKIEGKRLFYHNWWLEAVIISSLAPFFLLCLNSGVLYLRTRTERKQKKLDTIKQLNKEFDENELGIVE